MRVIIFFFLSHEVRIFIPEFNIGLYDKDSESDIFIKKYVIDYAENLIK